MNGATLLAVAARVGRARLIDNTVLVSHAGGSPTDHPKGDRS